MINKKFKTWHSEIVASFCYEESSPLVEGINNRVKVIKRQSYGDRKYENLEKLEVIGFHIEGIYISISKTRIQRENYI
ncbi:transposase [Psychrilyobacter sp.]|uniref:transposase n=1 Tax=Psychrilyobacter sp. TaxID=2586924 RepID=UPI003C74AFB8